jgi:hypothetical protein
LRSAGSKIVDGSRSAAMTGQATRIRPIWFAARGGDPFVMQMDDEMRVRGIGPPVGCFAACRLLNAGRRERSDSNAVGVFSPQRKQAFETQISQISQIKAQNL